MRTRLLIFCVAVGALLALLAVGLEAILYPQETPTTLVDAVILIVAFFCVVLLLLLIRRQAAQSVAARRQLERLVEAEARHDYHRKIQLEQLDLQIKRVRAVVEGVEVALRPAHPALQLPYRAESHLPKVLFVTSNGAGMGHLTRCIAVAQSGRKLFQSHFVSMSSSAEVVRRFGFEVLKYPSHGNSNGLSHAEWNDRFATYFDAVCRTNEPAAIVFDGTWIYRGVYESAKRHGIQMIWFRRGLWKTDANMLQVRESNSLVDHLLVPRDIADSADTGPVAKLEGTVVPAPTVIVSSEAFSRDDALRAMNLNPAKAYVLVQLGAGTINNVEGLRERVIEQVLQSSPSFEVVVGLSPLTHEYADERDRVHIVREFPLARMLRAFEFMVVAAGYNSIHESLELQVPAVVIPNLSTSTDNQALRAAEYARMGFGLAAATDAEVHAAVAQFLTSTAREAFRDRIASAELTVPIDSGVRAAEAIGRWIYHSEQDEND